MNFRIQWNQSPATIIENKVLRRGATALFMAETWRRLYNKFVPMDTGFLANDSVVVTAERNRGRIHHRARYAKFNYYGNFNFSRSKHALATRKWHEAAISANQHEILRRDLQAYVRRGVSRV